MRIIPMGAAPFVYIAIFHLPLSFLGLTLHNAVQQVVIGLLVGIPMAAFAVLWRMFIVGSWFRWPTVGVHILQGSFYFLVNAPVEELFFRGFMHEAAKEQFFYRRVDQEVKAALQNVDAHRGPAEPGSNDEHAPEDGEGGHRDTNEQANHDLLYRIVQRQAQKR